MDKIVIFGEHLINSQEPLVASEGWLWTTGLSTHNQQYGFWVKSFFAPQSTWPREKKFFLFYFILTSSFKTFFILSCHRLFLFIGFLKHGYNIQFTRKLCFEVCGWFSKCLNLNISIWVFQKFFEISKCLKSFSKFSCVYKGT